MHPDIHPSDNRHGYRHQRLVNAIFMLLIIIASLLLLTSIIVNLRK